jgi:rRNA maturation endonuclease Nob1
MFKNGRYDHVGFDDDSRLSSSKHNNITNPLGMVGISQTGDAKNIIDPLNLAIADALGSNNTKQQKFCKYCGTNSNVDSKFCKRCGKRQ